MVEKPKRSVDEAIEESAQEASEGLEGVKEALSRAEEAVEGARSAIEDAEGKPREGTLHAVERARVYLDEAKRYLTKAAQAMGRMAGAARDQVQAWYLKLKEQVEALSVKTKEVYEKVKTKVAEVDVKAKTDQVLEYIRNNPGKAVLIALAAGFLVGYVTRPRD